MAGEGYHFTNAERQVLENIQVPFAVYHLQAAQMRIVLISQGACTLFGVERSALIRYLDDTEGTYIHPMDRDDVLRLRQNAISCKEKEFRLTYRIRFPETANYLWIRVSCAMKQQDASFLMYTSYFDATDEQERRLQDQQKHRRQELLLEKILSTTQTALFWKDAERRFLGAGYSGMHG